MRGGGIEMRRGRCWSASTSALSRILLGGCVMLAAVSPARADVLVGGAEQASEPLVVSPLKGRATTYHSTTYDAKFAVDGIRVSASSGGSTTRYTWDSQSGGLPLLLADGAAQYVYGPGGLPIEQIARDGTVSYLHHDQLGSTRLLTTSAGASAGTASYSPFGQPTLVTGTASALGYAGQYTDPQTGLQYLRARDYDPVTAQFLSRDPIEDETGDPYAYAGNNPITNSDPSGLLFGVSFQDVADFAAGFGDSVTFGLTRQVRGLIGSDGTNYCSSSYSSGGIGGTAISMVLPAGAIARGAKIAAKGVAGAGTKGFGNVTAGVLREGEALTAAERWLGSGYREIAPGMFRSADNSRQFRMTASDLDAKRPHVHFESIGPNGREITESAHVYLR